MKVHANAALGPAGRLALVEAIESVWRLPRPIAGGTDGAWQARQSGDRALGRRIAPRGRFASRDGSVQPKRHRSCERAGRPTSALGAWRESAAPALDDLEGAAPPRSLTVEAKDPVGRPIVAMSGRGPERCCTSTSPAWRASNAPGMRSPACAT
jgi:hypothetical protein